jgi:UDP-N-acetylenolpyruvoylglucosamine reductase
MVLYKRRNLRIKKFNRRLWLGLQKDETFTFAKYTTYGCGGEAKAAYLPQNTLQAICAYEKAKRERQFCVIGNGSNVLASDCFYHGAVICTKKWNGIFRLSPTEIFCLAGTSVGELLQYCTRLGLSGLEYLPRAVPLPL